MTGDATDGHCDVSIILPCLNEEKTLPYCIGLAREALAEMQKRFGYSGEIVVADSGSSDRSREIAAALGVTVVQAGQRGYGRALIEGFSAARGRFLVMGDSDGSYDFRESVAMVEALAKGDDLCMGTRLKGRIMPGAMPFKNRYIGNPALSGLLRLLFRSGLSDAHSGMRAITAEAFRNLRLSSEGMEFASEMVIKAALLGLKRSEVPITLYPDRRGRRPHLRPWRDGWRHLRYMLMLAPGWLFLVPATLLAILSLAVAVPDLVLANPEGYWFLFGTHWLIMACTGLILSHGLFLFGMAGVVYGIRSGYRPPLQRDNRLARIWSLEIVMITGLVLVLTGAAGIVWAGVRWVQVDFSSPNQIRELLVCCTLLVIGAQHIFGGFLLSIIGGNRSKFLSPV